MSHLLDALNESSEKYKKFVKDDVERTGLSVDSRYDVSTLCISLIGMREELENYIQGRLLYVQALIIYKCVIKGEEPSIGVMRNFEVSLMQTKLAVETGNKARQTD